MSPNQEAHPERSRLVAFGLGKLDPVEAVDVETHVSECEECSATLLDLQGDTFMDLVRRADAVPLEPEQEATVDGDREITAPAKPGDVEFDLPPELVDHPRYRIVELLGKGGMGDVYKAEHKLMNRLVALKLIRHEFVTHPQAAQRFRREVQAAARLSHPNIVTAYDAEQAGDVHFLVMEYVDGKDLAEVVSERGRLSLTEACRHIWQAAKGLQAAHELQMVHRDIKPHNLMVTDEGQVKILDFGLATLAITDEDSGAASDDGEEKIESSRLTSIGAMMGTPDFISPEQAGDARSADIRSDIYSLGCTLYYLLSGQPPFEKDSVMETLKAHAGLHPEPIENVRVDVPVEVADVVRRMMAKEPAERFQTPAQVADALAPFVDAHRTDAVQNARSFDAGAEDAELDSQFKSTSRLLWAVGILSFVPACILLGNISWVAGWPLAVSLPITIGVMLAVAQGIIIVMGAHAIDNRRCYSRCIRAARASLVPISPFAWPTLLWGGSSVSCFLQREEVKTAFRPTKKTADSSPWQRRLFTAAGFIAWLVASGIVLYLVTDSGTLVIESEDEDVEVMVTKPSSDTHEGLSVRVVERVTGSSVVRLRSGHYRLLMMMGEDSPSANSECVLDKEQFVLSRGGRIIVKVMRKRGRAQDEDAEPAPASAREIDERITDS